MQPFVLIANCHPDLGRVLHDDLEEQGFETSVAANASDAVSQLRFRQNQPRLVIADVGVPEVDLELLARMEREPQLAMIPVIVITFSRSWRVWPSAVRRVVWKPFDLQALLRAVRECVREPTV